MKRKEKLVIHGNEFYVIDLDCLEKKGKETTNNEKSRGMRSRKHSNSNEK